MSDPGQIVICRNCGSSKHAECCARCGGPIRTRRRGLNYCTRRCEDDQRDEDAASAAMEAVAVARKGRAE